MTMIEYDPKEYEVLETFSLDDELEFWLVKFNTGYYGVKIYNQISNIEKTVLISPITDGPFEGLGCKSFLDFAKDSKNCQEKRPRNLVVMLGQDAPVEYKEVITREDEETLLEKVEICYEIMQLKRENSFHYKYGDYILTAFMLCFIIFFLITLVNSLHLLYGVI